MNRFLFILLLFINSLRLFAQVDNPVLVKANYEFSIQNYDKAIHYYSLFIESNMNLQYAFVMRGKCLFNEGFTDEAINDFYNAEKLEEGIASFELAKCYAAKNDAINFQIWLEKYLSKKNKAEIRKVKNEPAFIKMKNASVWDEIWNNDWYSKYEIELSSAGYLYDQNEYMNAIEVLDVLIDKKPHMDEAFILRAHCYEKLNQQKLSVNDVDKAIKYNRKNIQYYKYRSELNFQLGKSNKALEDINKAISIDVNKIDNYLFRAQILAKLNKPKQAILDFKNYLNYCYKDANAYYLLAMVESETGDLLNSILHFNKALEISPANYRAFVGRADAYSKTKTFMFAERDYSMALDIKPNVAELYYKRSQVRQKLGNINGSCTDLKKAVGMGYLDAEQQYYNLCK